MRKMRIAVYCSAKDSIPESYLVSGDAVGRWIGENGHTLVYGGATGGLMSRTSAAALTAGAQVVGVIPSRIIAAGRQADNCNELIPVVNMAERKQVMREQADVFVCLPGSYGTLDEMMDVISSAIVGEHHKPILILNQDNFYGSLQAQIDHMRSLCFIPEQEHYKPIFVQTLDELFIRLTTL
jgi:uncharacterized protein (TIGR00730 family)